MPFHKYPVRKSTPKATDKMYRATAPIVIADHLDLSSKFSSVKDQGQSSCCTGFGISSIAEYRYNLHSDHSILLSPYFVYANERIQEGDLNQDAGAIIADGIASVANIGIALQSLDGIDINEILDKPSDAAYADAANRKALDFRRVAQTEADILHCLAVGNPVVFGLQLYANFESDEVAKTGMVSLPRKGEELMGGHCIVIVGADRTKKLFKVRNSWSADWGLGGYCWIPFLYILDPNYASDFWTITQMSGV